MKTNLHLKQKIHPRYFLSDEEFRIVKEYFEDGKVKNQASGIVVGARSGLNLKKHATKLLLSAFFVAFAATTIPFLFITSEAKTDFDLAKVEKMQRLIPELQAKYDEISKDLSGLTGVVSYLVESEKKRAAEPDKHDSDSITSNLDKTSFKVATVAKDKTPLKLEKSSGSKTIIFVGKDSKLVIKREEGDWLLVASPKGGSAWIQKDFLRY